MIPRMENKQNILVLTNAYLFRQSSLLLYNHILILNKDKNKKKVAICIIGYVIE
jgi:hypothetical protein